MCNDQIFRIRHLLVHTSLLAIGVTTCRYLHVYHDARNGVLGSMPVTEGQVAYEWEHLLAKLAARSPDWSEHLATLESPGVHPLFEVVPGGVAQWERVAG